MSDGASGGTVRMLEAKLERNATEIQALKHALYGYPEYGQKGFKEEMQTRIEVVEKELHDTRDVCNSIAQERRDELSERRGIKRIIGYTGITSLLTLLTLITLIMMIWQGAVTSG